MQLLRINEAGITKTIKNRFKTYENMNNQDGKIWYGLGIDNAQLRADAEKSAKIFKSIGNDAVAEGVRIDNTFKKIAGSVAAVFTVQQLAAFTRQIAVIRGEFQQLEVAFTTLLQSKSKADVLMAQMVDLAAKTPFKLTDVATGAKQLIAYGFAADDITETLTRLGNIASGLGLPMERLTYLYGTTMTQGRLYARDLMQFTTSGIPMLQGLADMFGVTTDEVNDMVTAGKVGFPEVQKVIENLTNEGGKFHNLMEEQSKTIAGKISNLGDAIDVMFNKIGQSQEGAINTVLDSTKYLIEHYEEIGRVLGVLIASYGTYKAAVIAYAVAQKMAISAGNIKAFFDLAKGIKTAKDAQVALNLAMGANPFIKLASILMTVGGLIWAFARNSEDATEEVTGLNKALQDAGAEFEKESAKVQALQDVMNNSKVAYDERKRALNELNSIIPGYNAELNNEGILINNNTEAIKQYLVQLERQIKLKAVKEELEEAYKQKFLLEKDYDTKYKDWSSKNTNSAYHDKPIIDVVGMFGGRDLQKAEKAKDEAKQKLNDIETTISSLNSEIEKTADNTGGATNGVKSFAEQLQAAAVKVSTLKTQLTDLKAGKGNEPDFAKAITETGTELAEAEKKYNLLLGIDKKYLKEKESELEKAVKSFDDMQIKAINNLFDEETALKRKQITDKVKLIEFDRDTTITAIEAEKQAYIKLAEIAGEKADTSIFDKRIEIVQTSAKVDIANEENNQAKEQKKTLEEVLKEFETYQQKRERIKKEYDDKIALLDKNTQQAIIAEAQKQQIAALAELDNSVKGSTSVMTQLFADTSQASVTELRRIINEAKAM